MADEQEQTTEETKPDPTVSKLEKKNAALISQINDFKAKFDAIEAAQADEAQKREQENAAAKGDYEKAIEIANSKAAELEARIASQEKAHADALLKSKLERELVAKGATDEFFVDGVVARYMQMDERPEVDAYLSEVHEKSERYFKASPPPNAGDATPVSSDRGKTAWEARKEALTAKVPFGAQSPEALQAKQEAYEALKAHYEEHGCAPEGWTDN